MTELRNKILNHEKGLIAQIRENENGTATSTIYDYDNTKIREEKHDSYLQAIKDLTNREFYNREDDETTAQQTVDDLIKAHEEALKGD